MAFNPKLLLCLIAVIVVVPSSARELKTISPEEKEATIVRENYKAHDQAQVVDPITTNNMEKKEARFDKNQFNPYYPYPYPFPRTVFPRPLFPRPTFPFPSPYIPGLPWPYSPGVVGGVPSFPFPPLDTAFDASDVQALSPPSH
ncbi:hypothetical protein VNO78_03176 [Psophocarpus tetragonolobus]|uniref:Uncharacterized protein n=1 Tax=Psophocarpus tetragonolobus TaxID=3891 RepID=A0AAN9XVW3_PSOTE